MKKILVIVVLLFFYGCHVKVTEIKHSNNMVEANTSNHEMGINNPNHIMGLKIPNHLVEIKIPHGIWRVGWGAISYTLKEDIDASAVMNASPLTWINMSKQELKGMAVVAIWINKDLNATYYIMDNGDNKINLWGKYPGYYYGEILIFLEDGTIIRRYIDLKYEKYIETSTSWKEVLM